jgi:xylulokinase
MASSDAPLDRAPSLPARAVRGEPAESAAPRRFSSLPDGHAILALDLGTSAFKAGVVAASGLVAEPVVVPYELDTSQGRVTCPPERYFDAAMAALRQAASTAREAGCRIGAIGTSSQAQTFIALDRSGLPLSDAVVWTDSRATAEAAAATRVLGDVGALCGFRQLTGQQFLPKVMHLLGSGGKARERIGKLLLLNEYLAARLTGAAYGDETNQGMGGFFDISVRAWSQAALDLAGITAARLAEVAPCAGRSEPLLPEIGRALELDSVPVYLCGNDQTCAAAGVDLDTPGSLLCNFGTAMVVYGRRDTLPRAVSGCQIAGIDALTGRYFLLGLESQCGGVVDWLAHRVCPGKGVDRLLDLATASFGSPAGRPLLPFREECGTLPDLAAEFERRSSSSEPLLAACSALERMRDRFRQLVEEARGGAPAGPLIAAGGLSRSRAWREFLTDGWPEPLVRASTEHPGLLGIARIIAQSASRHNRKDLDTWSTDSST